MGYFKVARGRLYVRISLYVCEIVNQDENLVSKVKHVQLKNSWFRFFSSRKEALDFADLRKQMTNALWHKRQKKFKTPLKLNAGQIFVTDPFRFLPTRFYRFSIPRVTSEAKRNCIVFNPALHASQ